MSANRTRKHKVTLFLSDNEYHVLCAKTKACNMRSMSSTLRQLIISGYIYDVDYRYIREYNMQLSKIGNNLNQIAHHINSSDQITPDDFREVKNIMEQVLELQQKFMQKQPLAAESEIDDFNKRGLQFYGIPHQKDLRRGPLIQREPIFYL